MGQALGRGEQGEHRHRPQVGQGDPGGDHPAQEQVAQPQQEHKGGHLPHAAPPLAQEHDIQPLWGQGALVEVGQGGGGGHRVHRGEGQLLHRLGPGGHEHGQGPGQHPAGQGGIHKILPQPAVELLDHDNGEGSPHHRHPVGGAGGQAEGQQQAGDAGGQVPHRGGLAGEFSVNKLKQDAGGDGHGGQGQGPVFVKMVYTYKD